MNPAAPVTRYEPSVSTEDAPTRAEAEARDGGLAAVCQRAARLRERARGTTQTPDARAWMAAGVDMARATPPTVRAGTRCDRVCAPRKSQQPFTGRVLQVCQLRVKKRNEKTNNDLTLGCAPWWAMPWAFGFSAR